MANPGTTKYPGQLDDFDNPGTATYEDDTGYGHELLHSQVQDATEAIEVTVGTTAGTNILKNFVAGDLAARNSSETFGTITSALISASGTFKADTIQEYTAGNGNNLPNQHGCYLYLAGSQNVNNATYGTINFDTELYDIGGLHGTANPSRITIITAGIYQFEAQGVFNIGTSGQRQVNILRNGTQISSFNPTFTGGDYTYIPLSTMSTATAGDYFQMRVYHVNGGTLAVIAGFGLTYLAAHKIS